MLEPICRIVRQMLATPRKEKKRCFLSIDSRLKPQVEYVASISNDGAESQMYALPECQIMGYIINFKCHIHGIFILTTASLSIQTKRRRNPDGNNIADSCFSQHWMHIKITQQTNALCTAWNGYLFQYIRISLLGLLCPKADFCCSLICQGGRITIRHHGFECVIICAWADRENVREEKWRSNFVLSPGFYRRHVHIDSSTPAPVH